MQITSPVKGYSESTEVGPYIFDFKDGVAQYDESKHLPLNDGVKRFLKDSGYGLGSEAATSPEPAPEPADPREVGDEQVGTKIRDAAVDPMDGDFLAPTNAGEANPHGSEVVSPEVHASQGVRPVKGGEVHVGDPDAQDAAETAHTEEVVDGEPVVLTEQEKADSDAAGGPGLPLDEKPTEGEDTELKGAALDEALTEAGLPKTGTADEKRERLAEHQKGQG